MGEARVERFSPKALARWNGVFTLVGIVTGAFDIGYVRNTLIVAGNAQATYQNILAHETLFRLGFTAHIVLLLCNIPGEILFFYLFRRVNPVLAALGMCCGLIGTAIESVDMLNAYAPVKMAMESGALGALTTQQLQALSYLFVQLEDAGLVLSFVFYGLGEMVEGSLMARSRFVPRVIGVLLALAGLSYFTHGFLSFAAPALDAKLYPYILYPCLPGEGSSALWFTVMGIHVERWRAWGER